MSSISVLPTVFAVALLGAALGFAVLRPRRLPEVTAAAPLAILAVVTGLVNSGTAIRELRTLGPTVGFLAAILALAQLCEAEGVFTWAGTVMSRNSRGNPARLLTLVFLAATATTAVLSLDATVILLTPVVLATTKLVRIPARPHLYACAHLANTASLLLPVANLTNLLAFDRSGLDFAQFALLMALPSATVIAVEYLAFRHFFAIELTDSGRSSAVASSPPPAFAIAVLSIAVAGFAAAGPIGIAPVWIAVAAALVLTGHRLARTQPTARLRLAGTVLHGTHPLFCLFVLALGVLVAAVTSHGLGSVLGSIIPEQTTLIAILAVATLAAVLANLVNNLPATLLLLPAVTPSPGLLLAMLLGVNIGPNLTYAGSLATLLWRRLLRQNGIQTKLSSFTLLGAITVPSCLVTGALALWVSLRLTGLG
jgi:arsenical pump membrane protein